MPPPPQPDHCKADVAPLRERGAWGEAHPGSERVHQLRYRPVLGHRRGHPRLVSLCPIGAPQVLLGLSPEGRLQGPPGDRRPGRNHARSGLRCHRGAVTPTPCLLSLSSTCMARLQVKGLCCERGQAFDPLHPPAMCELIHPGQSCSEHYVRCDDLAASSLPPAPSEVCPVTPMLLSSVMTPPCSLSGITSHTWQASRSASIFLSTWYRR